MYSLTHIYRHLTKQKIFVSNKIIQTLFIYLNKLWSTIFRLPFITPQEKLKHLFDITLVDSKMFVTCKDIGIHTVLVYSAQRYILYGTFFPVPGLTHMYALYHITIYQLYRYFGYTIHIVSFILVTRYFRRYIFA